MGVHAPLVTDDSEFGRSKRTDRESERKHKATENSSTDFASLFEVTVLGGMNLIEPRLICSFEMFPGESYSTQFPYIHLSSYVDPGGHQKILWFNSDHAMA